MRIRRVSNRAEIPVFSEKKIAARVKKLAREICANPLKPDIAVPVLAGAFVFAADLLRVLAREGLDLETEFIWLRSYGQDEKPENITVLKAPTGIVRGKTVLLIDGVLESGGTLARAKELLFEQGAAAIISVVAVMKPHATPAAKPDYVGFTAGREFLFGYGMDRAGHSRGLPDICVSKDKD
jgi:hypoxanthine phosphoribosyltransferase